MGFGLTKKGIKRPWLGLWETGMDNNYKTIITDSSIYQSNGSQIQFKTDLIDSLFGCCGFVFLLLAFYKWHYFKNVAANLLFSLENFIPAWLTWTLLLTFRHLFFPWPSPIMRLWAKLKLVNPYTCHCFLPLHSLLCHPLCPIPYESPTPYCCFSERFMD